MPKLEPGKRVILWMEDDAHPPGSETLECAWERITNEMSRFNFDPHGRYHSRCYLDTILKGGHHLIKVLSKEDHGASYDYHLSNGLSVCISGEGCTSIYVRLNQ